MTAEPRTCERCGCPMTHEGTASTATHHTVWWSCGCGNWVKDSTPVNPPGQQALL